jgi:hypothetical protein
MYSHLPYFLYITAIHLGVRAPVICLWCGALFRCVHPLALKLGVTKVVIRSILIVGCKPRVDWTFLRTYSLQNYFLKRFSFILVFVSLILFKQLSYSLLFLNFRWFILTAQPARALDVSPLFRWHEGMCHLSRSHSSTRYWCS